MAEAWYPHAQRRPLGEQTEPVLHNPSIICLHTMVGSLWGTDSYFGSAGYGGTESHFGIGYDGEVLQWQDLEHQADANLDGNHRVISIETSDYDEPPFGRWDTGDASQVPAWTDAQIEAIAQLVAWLCDQFDIPCVPISDSRPERRGVGWHRQGIDNWRVTGGEKWSSSTGKVCPGDRRVAQFPQVIARAQQILTGGQPDQPEKPPEEDEDDMKYPYRILADAGRGGPAYAWTPTSMRAISGEYFQSLVASGLCANEIEFLSSRAFDIAKDMMGAALRQAAATVDAALADDFAEEEQRQMQDAPPAEELLAASGARKIDVEGEG